MVTDYTAYFAIGLISYSQGHNAGDLLAFWTPFLKKYLSFKRPSWSTNTSCLDWIRRQYESISTFNLIEYSLKECEKMFPNIFDYAGTTYIKIIHLLGLKDLRDKMKYRSSTPLTKELREFIFKELKSKSMLADDPETAKRMCSARGDWVLQDSDWNSTEHSTSQSYIVDVDYDQSILLWHIATDQFCYNMEPSSGDGCKFSKTLSDYMLYLLVMQPTLTSSVAGIGKIRFWDTCAEAKKFFSSRELGSGRSGVDEQQLEACWRILEVNTEVEPVAVKGDRSKLFDACILAKQLMELKEKKWELMSKVWVELLSYTAGHCRANDHAQLLSKGGELVTFVWLLMVA